MTSSNDISCIGMSGIIIFINFSFPEENMVPYSSATLLVFRAKPMNIFFHLCYF